MITSAPSKRATRNGSISGAAAPLLRDVLQEPFPVRGVKQAGMRVKLVVALTMIAAGCATRTAVSPAPVPSSFDDAIDALIRRGCYRCLEQAYDKSQQQRVRIQAFEAATLLTLRSKELGLPSESWLERARALASPQDNPADVTDNLLRLVYYYQAADQPYQAAVLGEHIARTARTTGGKSATAGLLALNGYISAASKVKVRIDDPSQAEAAAATSAAPLDLDTSVAAGAAAVVFGP